MEANLFNSMHAMRMEHSEESHDTATVVNACNCFLSEQLPAGCVGAVRLIKNGDESLLSPIEAQGLERAVLSVRRASGAGRDLARALCAQIGISVAALPRAPQQYPIWPDGLRGAISHDADFAAAIVASADQFGGVGIDIEPAEDLSLDLRTMISPAEELAAFSDMPFSTKALFSIKEAVYKAVYPHDGIFLDFHDVKINRAGNTAATNYGRTVFWRVLAAPHVLAVAWW